MSAAPTGPRIDSLRADWAGCEWGGSSVAVEPPRVLIDDAPVAWRFLGAQDTHDGIVAEWSANEGALTYTCQWTLDPGGQVLCIQGHLRNQDRAPACVASWPLFMLPLGLPAGAIKALGGFQRLGQAALGCRAVAIGTAPNKLDAFVCGPGRGACWIGLFDEPQHNAMAIGWLTYAPVLVELGDSAGLGLLELTGHLTSSVEVAPGADWSGPRALLCPVHGPLDQATHTLREHVRDMAAPADRADIPWRVAVAGGESGVDAALSRVCLEHAAQAGLEGVLIGPGWQQSGVQVDKQRFPKGLRPLALQARRMGLRFGAALDWSLLTQETHDHQALLANLTELVEQAGLDWLLLHSAVCDGETARDYEPVLDALRASCPALGLAHCGDSGVLSNYRMVQQHHGAVACPQGSPLATRCSLLALAHLLPPRYLGSRMSNGETPYERRSHFLGGPLLIDGGLLSRMAGTAAWADLGRDINLHGEMYDHLGRARVFPLAMPTPERPDWDGWDATGLQDNDTTAVLAFRSRGRLPERVIPVRGLVTTILYYVSFLDSEETYQASGEEIMRDGLRLALDAFETSPQGHCSEVIWIRSRP